MHIYLNRITSLIALKIVISSTYDAIIKNRFKKKLNYKLIKEANKEIEKKDKN